MRIRPYEAKDRQTVCQICTGVSNHPMMENPLFAEAILETFCRYYLDFEPENCFVAVDDKDVPQGYVLCAQDFQEWENLFRREIIGQSDNPVVRMMGEGTIEAMRPFAKDFPAHLHIDLLPACRGQGVGRQLMDGLCIHLRQKNISGLMLNVAADNTGAQRFYEKCGFTLLEKGEQEFAYGIPLKEIN